MKYMDIQAFRQHGFLQEANRKFFHPLGLALEVTVDHKGIEHISGVWDRRDDPEGIEFAPEVLATPLAVARAHNVEVARLEKHAKRCAMWGHAVQPIATPQGGTL